MSKTIIAVRGQPDSGKTSTIKLACSELRKAGELLYSNTRSDAQELKEVVEIDGVRVGIVSAGDTPARLERSLQYLFDKGCAVIVCAARLNRRGEPEHETIDVLDDFADEHQFSIEWIDKERESNDTGSANREVAECVVKKILAAVKRAQLIET